MLNELLEYQKLDIELIKLKKEEKNSNSTESVEKLNATIKDCQNKILDLEEKSKDLLTSFEKLMEVQKKGLNLVDRYKNLDVENMSEDELKDYESKISQTAKQLAELENRLLSNNQQIKQVVMDYRNYRKQLLDAKDMKEDLKKNSEDKKEQQNPEIENINQKKLELEKLIEKNKLEKYKLMKKDGIFPVLVPLVDKRCGGCRVELSSVALDKLKNDGIGECEQCGRIIYTDKK